MISFDFNPDVYISLHNSLRLGLGYVLNLLAVHCVLYCRTIGDELGEAKASGNLGNTLKLLGRFDEAVVCCQRHLEITGAMYDRVCCNVWLYSFDAFFTDLTFC